MIVERLHVDPARYRLHQAAVDFGIEEAKRIKNWPALEDAVDLKIAEQEKFIAWRGGTIREAGGPRLADRSVGKLSSKEITDITGVSEKRAERMAAKLRRQFADRPVGKSSRRSS